MFTRSALVDSDIQVAVAGVVVTEALFLRHTLGEGFCCMTGSRTRPASAATPSTATALARYVPAAVRGGSLREH